MPRIEAIEIDDPILDKIESKHGVEWHEVEEACYSDELHIRRGREGLYKAFSRTESGRFLLVVLVDLGAGVWRVVTARHDGTGAATISAFGRLGVSRIDEEVTRLESGEAWEESDEPVVVDVRRPLDKVVPVRLPSAKWEELRTEAQELGVGPTTLARMWILERLRQTASPDKKPARHADGRAR